MTVRTLRAAAGLSLVAEHFLLLVLVAVCAAWDRYTTEELFTAFGIIGPLFAAYTTAAVRRLLSDEAVVDERPVRRERAVLIVAIPAFFFSCLVAIVLWKALGSLAFDAFVKMVGVAETFLGVYVGMVVEHMFGPVGDR